MEQDLFLDEEFSSLDTREHPEGFATALAKIADEELPPLPEDEPEPVVEAAQVVDEPEVIDAGDGMTVTIEKGPKGWRAVLDANTGARPEVYEGKTKNEVLQNVLIGKVHATKKINQLNKQVKLQTVQPDAAPVQAAVERSIGRTLTADEQIKFNTQFAANPAQALEDWFNQRVGVAPEKMGEVVKTTENTNKTSLTVLCAQEAKEFLRERPDYYNLDENYHALLKYLVNQKDGDDSYDVSQARRFASQKKFDALSTYLTAHGIFTSENLAEAYDELTEADLLIVSPEQTEAEEIKPAVQAKPAKPAIQEPRKTRAAKLPGSFGLHRTDTGAPPPPATEAPSVDELENQSDDDIEKLFHATRRLAAQTRR